VDLSRLGWTPALARALEPYFASALPGRVAEEHRGAYRLISAEGEIVAVVAGRLRSAATRRRDLPAVGDWVAFERAVGGASVIHGVLPRTSLITRTAAGSGSDEQVIAANVDTLIVMTALDRDFNVRRLERYAALAYGAGVAPLVVLNKADRCDDAAAKIAAARRAVIGAPVLAMSIILGDGVAALEPHLAAQTTIAIVGSSGVGKSTLVNALCGAAVVSTGATRESDGRGRHTTTSRSLIPLACGAVLLDTPGMRELRLPAHGDGLTAAFADIDTLARACRFADCSHRGEPGCAVIGAVDAARLANYEKLRREAAFVERKTDARAAALEKQRWKKLHRDARERTRSKRRGDG